MKKRNATSKFKRIMAAALLVTAQLITLAAPFSSNAFATSNTPKLTSKSYSINTDIVSSFCLETHSYVQSAYPGLLTVVNHGDIANRTEIRHFFDNRGLYNIAYADNKNLQIDRITTDFVKVEHIEIPKYYPQFGDITSDNDGNLYVIWGRTDTAGKGGISTVAVTKHSYDGKRIGVVEYYTTAGEDSTDCKQPFYSGGCHAIITSDNHFVCNFAKLMYNGHQGSGIVDIDINTMTRTDRFDERIYMVSHSFDQRVVQLADGGICFVNKGDAYPRGYSFRYFNTKREDEVPFNFYGKLGENHVYSWLGNVVEAGENLFLVGSSARSLSADATHEPQDLFIQLIGDQTQELEGSVQRQGTSGSTGNDEKFVVNHNVKWLTRCVAPYTVANPQVISVDTDRFLILWEEFKQKSNGVDSEFVESFYMIMNGDGTVARDPEPLGVRLNTHEDPIYRSGAVYWCAAGYIVPAKTDVTINGTVYEAEGYGIKDGKTVKCYKLASDGTGLHLTAPVVKSIVATANGVSLTWDKVTLSPKYKVLRDDGDGMYHVIGLTTNPYFVDTTALGGKSYRYTVCCTDDSGMENISSYNQHGWTVISTTFKDVPVGSWYEKAVTYCVENSLFGGTAPGVFSPNNKMTRAMFVQVLYALEGSPNVAPSNRFKDVKSTAWYAKAVEWAYSNGITAGVGDGIFAPNQQVTREQFATFLLAYAGYKGIEINEFANLSPYKDIDKISGWATRGMSWAVAKGLISGTSHTTLSPKGIATRAQAAVMFQKLCQKVLIG